MRMTANARSSLFQDTFTRRVLLRRMAVGGAALSFPSILAACASGDEAVEGSPSPGGETGTAATSGADIEELTWMVNRLVHLDLARAADPGSKTAQAVATESLVTLDENLDIVGWLAESWEQVDGQTYVYRLRPGVTFWDGSPVTVEDVIYSFERHNDPDLASIEAGFTEMESIEETGENEITVKLQRPLAMFRFTPTYAPIVKKAFAEELGEAFGAPGDNPLMGTGPYKPTRFSADDSVTYERYDDYWGELPPFRNLTVQLIGDSQAAQLAMRAREIDGTFFVTVSEVEDWRAIDGVRVESAPGLIPGFFTWDLREEPWSDVHVRRAIAHAVDKEGLVNALLPGAGQPAESLVPRDQWAGLVVPAERVDEIYASLTQYEFDLDAAREELAQSAFPDGFSATLKYGDAKQHLGRAALNLSENLSQIGIELEVEEVPMTEEIADVTGHENIGMRALSFTAGQLDPADYPEFMLPSQYARAGGFNVPHYENDRVDELLDTQALSTDPEERADMIAEVMQIIAEELPYLPFWIEDIVMASREDYTYTNFHAFFFQMGVWPANVRPA
jgi:peptide/nickel transport system substrate-binding protein